MDMITLIWTLTMHVTGGKLKRKTCENEQWSPWIHIGLNGMRGAPAC